MPDIVEKCVYGYLLIRITISGCGTLTLEIRPVLTQTAGLIWTHVHSNMGDHLELRFDVRVSTEPVSPVKWTSLLEETDVDG